MDVLTCFTVLSHRGKRPSYDTPVPSFMLIALLMDMEEKGLATTAYDGRFTITKSPSALSYPERLLSEFVRANEISSLRELIDRALRCLSYKNLKIIAEAIIDEICNNNNFILKSKGNLIITDEAYNEIHSELLLNISNNPKDNNDISVAALLYGCRLLKKHLDKDKYRLVVSLIKEGVTTENRPLSSYIINNIDLIRGHIMGIVAN